MLRLALRNAPSVSNLELALRNKFSAIDLKVWGSDILGPEKLPHRDASDPRG